MIRILIVEDEPPIARALAHLIKQHPSFEVVGIENDGSKALENLKNGGVDIVFTDIRMPVMDGIALLGHIYTDYPHIMSVVISGYQEFSYAKAAIGFKALDYILKPLAKDKIHELLTRLENECIAKRRQIRHEQVQKSLAGEVVDGQEHPDCFVLTACIGAVTPTDSDWVTPGQEFWSNYDLESLLKQILGAKSCYVLFNGKFKAQVMVVIEMPELPELEGVCRQLFERLREDTRLSVVVAGHAMPISINDVGRVITRLNRILCMDVPLYESRIICRDVLSKKTGQIKRQPDSMLIENTVASVLVQDAAKLESAIRNVIGHTHKKEYSIDEFLALWDMVLNDGRISTTIDAAELLILKWELIDAVAISTSYDQLFENLMSVLLVLGDGKLEMKKAMKEMVDEIEQYLIANYNKSVSIEVLANRFGFVPSYVSKVFRKHKKVSPSEFLTQYRINKAKKIMSDRPEALVRDVANLVGYNDPYYFSKVFKKETGIWPTEYQKQLEAQ